MARNGKPSRRQRNQAKWDAHNEVYKVTPVAVVSPKAISDRPTEASYAGGKKPQLITGSIQGAPHKITVTQRKGIKLQPFADYIPKTASDYATLGPHREWLDSERAGRYVRKGRESVEHMANSVTGGEGFQSYAERLPGDVAANVYRDGAGRIMRLTTTPDADVIVRTRVHHGKNARGTVVESKVEEMIVISGDRRPEGVPAMVTRERATSVRTQARNAKLDDERAVKREARDAKKLIREQETADRAQRRLDRMAGRGENSVTRVEMDAAARAVLAAHGITDPTRKQIAAARDMITAQKQIQAYANDHTLAA